MIRLRNRREVVAGGLGLAVGGLMTTYADAAQDWAGKRVLNYSHTGHTRTAAEMIHRQIGGDFVQIETVAPYPDDYDALVAQNACTLLSGQLETP